MAAQFVAGDATQARPNDVILDDSFFGILIVSADGWEGRAEFLCYAGGFARSPKPKADGKCINERYPSLFKNGLFIGIVCAPGLTRTR